MTAIEIAFVVFLNVFTLFAMAALAWVVIIVPMREDIDKLKEKQQQANWQAMKAPPVLPGMRPANTLPSIDDLPESVFDIGEYGDDHSTPQEVEEDMSELATAVREADKAWLDIEDLKHGKRAPIIYSGQ